MNTRKVFAVAVLFLVTPLMLMSTRFTFASNNNDQFGINYFENAEFIEYTNEVMTSDYQEIWDEIDPDEIMGLVLEVHPEVTFLDFEIVWNSTGNPQYILLEWFDAYFIYDIISADIIEYNLYDSAPWPAHDVKIYNGPGGYCYLENSNIIDVFTEEIVDTDFEIKIMPELSFGIPLNTDVLASAGEINTFLNRHIYHKKLITNNYFFKNFPLLYEYNINDSCTIVALSLLLAYYDTFYNDNIIPDQITSSGFNGGLPFEAMIKGKSSTKVDIESWITDGNSPEIGAGPSKDFHDYLCDLGDRKLNKNTSFTIPEAAQLTKKYLTEQGLSTNILAGKQAMLRNTLKSALDNDLPVMLGIKSYHYYYQHWIEDSSVTPPVKEYYDVLKKTRNDLANSHVVVAYGYEETSLGTYYYTHTGWSSSLSISEKYGLANTLIKSTSFIFVLYFTPNSTRIPSANYVYSHLDCSFTIDPNNELEDYFEHIAVDDDCHYYKCRKCNTNLPDGFSHQYTEYSSSNEYAHILKCKYCDRTTSMSLNTVVDVGIFNVTQVPNGVRINGVNYLPQQCHLRIPNTIGEKKVVEIADFAFANLTNLEGVEINSKDVIIGNYAFENCENLESVKINNANENIGNRSFKDCVKLYGYTIPGSISPAEHRRIDTWGDLYWQDHYYLLGACITCEYEHNGHVYEHLGKPDYHYEDCITCRHRILCNEVAILIDTDEMNHEYYCHYCDYHLDESHTYNGGKCTVCNYTHQNHSYENTYTGTYNEHYLKCSICGYKNYCTGFVSIVEITDSKHTFECDVCPFVLVENHSYNIEQVCNHCNHNGGTTHVHIYNAAHIPATPGLVGPKKHISYCSCGATKNEICFGRMDDPYTPIFCLLCGQEMGGGSIIFSITLPNGDVYISNQKITLQCYIQLAHYLNTPYSYIEYIETYLIQPNLPANLLYIPLVEKNEKKI